MNVFFLPLSEAAETHSVSSPTLYLERLLGAFRLRRRSRLEPNDASRGDLKPFFFPPSVSHVGIDALEVALGKRQLVLHKVDRTDCFLETTTHDASLLAP